MLDPSTPWQVIQGDCLGVLPTLPDCSVDSVVCDPPYELGFMGKAWDKSGIAYNVDVWRECLRVLKPGGHLLAFGGSRTYHRLACAVEDAGFDIRDQIMWLYGSGFPKSHNLDGDWKGWGTALKPAHEPIVVARKPIEGTVAENVQRWGTGAVNVDACRVGTSKEIPASPAKANDSIGTFKTGDRHANSSGFDANIGRWPANIIHDGSDEVVNGFPSAKGCTVSGTRTTENTNGWGMNPMERREWYGDSGSAARFFYCAKASKRDRDEGCEGMEASVELIGAAGHKINPTTGRQVVDLPRKNHHPTVKPTDLMRYLCRLVTPPSGLVLDPFAGSGSTGKGAVSEGFRFIGIELSDEYAEIARKRIAKAANNLFPLDTPTPTR
jgi:DNA modification methylase